MENEFYFPFVEKFILKSLDSCLIEAACISAGLDTFRLSPLMMIGSDGASGKTFPFFRTASSHTSVPGRQICGFKQWTRQVLNHQGIAVPRGAVFSRERMNAALDFAESLGWPVVIKPSAGTGGVMVTTNISNASRLKDLMEQFGPEELYIIEKHCDGSDYRVLVVGGRVVSVLRREAAKVFGDGVSTIRKLIRQKNSKRKPNPRLRNSLIKSLGPTVKNTLDEQGLDLNSVPGNGVTIALSTAANVSSGGDCWDVTHETHHEVIEFIEKAVRAIPGIRYAGVDVLIQDHTKPLNEQGAWICEVNSSAEISMHEFAPVGEVKAVSKEIVADVMAVEGLIPRFRDERQVRIVIGLGRGVDEAAKGEVLSWFSGMELKGDVFYGEDEIALEVSGTAREIAIISGMAVSPRGLNGHSCEVVASSAA